MLVARRAMLGRENNVAAAASVVVVRKLSARERQGVGDGIPYEFATPILMAMIHDMSLSYQE